jgi:hypothetical protein
MFDLFGEIVVTQEDIVAWVSAVAPAFMATEQSFARYVKHWHVADKVRAAKLAGTFESTITRARDRRAMLARRFGLA